MVNRLWVIETKMRHGWIPTLDLFTQDDIISGVHYTRKESKAAKQAMIDAKTYSRFQRRVKKYEAVE